MIGVLVFAAALAGTQAFDADALPKAQAEIKTACGAAPTLAVRWEAFGDDEPAAQSLMTSGLAFLTTAFATVCKDATLKGEVAKQIAKISLSQAYGAADPVIYLSERTLHIEYLWVKGEPAPDAAYVAAEIASRLRGEEAEAP
jgi:hypothetical protein